MARKLQHGGGAFSLIIALLLVAICGYAGWVIVPAYYNAKEFESALVNEGVRAGARYYTDEMITKEIVQLAKGFEIALKSDNIRIRRFGDRVELIVEYDMPLDFSLLNYNYQWHFVAKTTNHLGMI